MGKNRQPSVAEVSYRPSLSAPIGMDILDFAELSTRGDRRGLDLSSPLRPAFHHLIHVRKGPVRHTVDFQDHTLDSGSWLWVRAGQVHQYVPRDHLAARGTIIIWQPGFVPAEPPHDGSPMLLTSRHARSAGLALHHLAHEYSDLASIPLDAHIETLRHLLSVLLLRLTHACPGPASPGSGGDVFRRFRAAVERDFADSHHVNDYAAALGYSVRTLSRAARAATGSTAKQYLDARILLEARRLLVHTDATSAEISRRLGFPDPSDFTKFFRKRDGATPLRFRAVARGRARGMISTPASVE
ncbi:helix-turn-helix transcriptional regulator [Streptomyces sp. NBC_00271]|uniref:helix-turn-helix transcriptional regulator n=1 Tax=Streptomyces sp. NBC_00271 TaxID=2975697 RepID=UPI002E291CAA|nr:AraC family transcriptional regulator [Streptomyces sp. NBC_00271]